jgi:gluconokinase
MSTSPRAARLAARHGHFFRADLLDSQLATLEKPEPAERVMTVPADGPADQVAEQIIGQLRLA